MAQKAKSESTTFSRTLNDARNVGDDKRTVITIWHKTEVRLHSSKRIIGNLWLCCTHRTEKGRFTRIWKAYQTYVSKHLEFEHYLAFQCWLTRLCIAWSLIGRGAEMPVTQSATSSLEQHHFLVMLCDFAKVLAIFSIIDHSTHRHLDHSILSILAKRLVLCSRLSVGSEDMSLITQMEQSPIVTVAMQDDRTALASIAAIWTSLWDIFCAMQVRTATTALSRAAINSHIIYEIAFCHCTLSALLFKNITVL